MITEWDCFPGGNNQFITVPDGKTLTFATLKICQRCYALVGEAQTYFHAEWHNELINMGAEREYP